MRSGGGRDVAGSVFQVEFAMMRRQSRVRQVSGGGVFGKFEAQKFTESGKWLKPVNTKMGQGQRLFYFLRVVCVSNSRG